VEALSDAEEVVRIAPTWAKGFSRKGAASLALDDCYNATLAYRAGLKIEPTNTSMLQVYIYVCTGSLGPHALVA
jgi:stress-induced-phosphoprotein 1